MFIFTLFCSLGIPAFAIMDFPVAIPLDWLVAWSALIRLRVRCRMPFRFWFDIDPWILQFIDFWFGFIPLCWLADPSP
jgi:hypothetical protein